MGSEPPLHCGHDAKYRYFHPAAGHGSQRYRCAACDDQKGNSKFMQDNQLLAQPLDLDLGEAEIEKRVHDRIRNLVEQKAKCDEECRELREQLAVCHGQMKKLIERDSAANRELTRQRDRLQRDLDAALTVMANHDLSIGDAITMPLKQDVQIGELTRHRDELLNAVRYAECYGEDIGDAWLTRQMQHAMKSVKGKTDV